MSQRFKKLFSIDLNALTVAAIAVSSIKFSLDEYRDTPYAILADLNSPIYKGDFSHGIYPCSFRYQTAILNSNK